MAKKYKRIFKMEMLLLKIISEGDCYGYQIVQTLDKISNGTIHMLREQCTLFYIDC